MIINIMLNRDLLYTSNYFGSNALLIKNNK